MKKKQFFTSIGLVVILVAGSVLVWAWVQQQNPGPEISLSEPVEETFVIRYDGISFRPQQIVVDKGTKVYFVNESKQQRPMYIASDDHPTHENYQGFDAAGVNQKFPALGESFEFVFENTGTWGYHDHNFPSAQGKIIVKEE